MNVPAKKIWIQCHTCGNRATIPVDDECPPETCGGCDRAKWKLMRTQQGLAVNENDSVEPDGVDWEPDESGRCRCTLCTPAISVSGYLKPY